jgi:flagellar hook-associated protein 1 FlgK
MGGVGLRSAFDIGRKTLRSQLAGLNVTGNNIANVNTPGYSRQQVNLVTDLPLVTSDGVFGSGVKVDGVRRLRDALVDRQLRNELHNRGKNEILERIFKQIEVTVNEPSDFGLRALISKFFDNYSGLTNDPENATTRFNLRESAKLVIDAFHRIDKQLRILSDDIDFELRRDVKEVNRLTSQIAKINKQIFATEGLSKGTSNELRDQRDQALDQLSELVDITVFETSNGSINVGGSEGSLVAANIPTLLKTVVTNAGGDLVSTIFDANANEEFGVKNGKIAGLIESRSVSIPKFRGLFNTLAKRLVEAVNNIHKIGVGLKGTKPDIPKDNLFFTGDDAVTIELAQAIVDDVNNIAAGERIDTIKPDGSVVTSGSPGDNTIALEIADLKQNLILSDGTESLIDFFNTIVSDIGIDTKTAGDNVVNQQLLIRQFLNLRDSQQGVSLDEEFINLIKFQRGFQGGAKLIQTLDEMFETLINI